MRKRAKLSEAGKQKMQKINKGLREKSEIPSYIPVCGGSGCHGLTSAVCYSGQCERTIYLRKQREARNG